MSQSVEECQTRLGSIQSYRRQFVAITRATITSSRTLDFAFRGPLGFEGQTVVAAVGTDSPEEFAFESWGGNIELIGLVEFAPVRSDCTEITLALEYQIKNRFFAWLDRKFRFVDRFLSTELRSLRAHFEGVAAPVAEPAPSFGLFEPLRA